MRKFFSSNVSKNRVVVLSVISIILVFMLLLGSTYSLFTTSNIDEDVNVYQTGVLDITYTLSDENVGFASKTPISEEEANNIEPYRITITNDGNVDYKFNLILVDTTATDVINYDYITTKVGKLESSVLSECPSTDINGEVIIKSGIIVPAGESVDVDVKIWLNEETQNSEIGKSFYGKLKVDGFAIYNDNDDIDNSVLIAEYSSLSGMEVGSYVAYTGSNGCIGEACNGVDASSTYSLRSGDSFSKNGWRIAYKDGNNVYLTTAGSPEYLCTSSDGTTSNSECTSYLDSSNLSTHITNLNNVALKYCNPTYAYSGVCDNSTTWNMNDSDYKKITGNDLSKCFLMEGNTSCGYNNNLIDNGNNYWFSDIYATNNQIYFWDGEARNLSNNNSDGLMGIRPVIKLDASVYVMSGNGTTEDPFVLGIPEVDKRTYKVSFDVNGGSGEFNDIEVMYGTNYGKLPTPNKTGYNFSGWYTDSSFTNEVTDISEVELKHDHTLYAKWEAKTIYVYFDGNGGDVSQTLKEVTYDMAYGELPTPERTGYTFSGWYTEESGGSEITSSSIVSVEEEQTLYARWSANSYTVTFNAGEGSVTPNSKTVTYDSTYGELPIPERLGYNFLGWYTEENGGGTKITSASTFNTVGGLTLYAHWELGIINITFNPNGGSVDPTTADVIYGGTYGELPTPTRTGYTFNGWYTASSGGDKIESTTTVTTKTAQTLYAQWTINTYTVSYYNGSTKINTSSHTYGTAKNLTTWANLGATVTNWSYGWSFAGWSTENNNTTRNYTDGQSVNNLIETSGGNINLYAVYTRTITFKHGVNGAISSTAPQYWNSYGTTNGTHLTAVASPSLTAITNWTSSGFRNDYSPEAKKYNYNENIYPEPNGLATLYGIYTRNINFYSGINKATSHGSKIQYLNSNYNIVSSITPYTPTAITNWTALGFRNDETASFETYSINASISPQYNTQVENLYAVYSRQLTVSYNGNGSTEGSMANTSKTVYLNTNSTTTSSQTVTLAANGFSRTGHTFSKWAEGSASGTQYGASTNYRFNFQYNDSTFGTTMFAVWTANTYTVTFNANGGSMSSSTMSVSYGSAYGELPEPTKEGYNFLGWYTALEDGEQVTSETVVNILSNQTLYAHWEEGVVTTPFITEVMAVNATSDASIDFSKTSDATGTNGIYVRNGTEDDTYPIYYYRGVVDNNLIFANTCWKIVRTTETGGLKLIYNGTPTDGTCDNTGKSSQIGTKAFNSSRNSPAYVGYMYGDVYEYSTKSMSSDTTEYVYGNDVSYANGTYTLTDTTSGAWSSVYSSGLNNYHYTCFTTGTTCISVYYVYYTNSSTAYYVTLTGGVNIETALSNMLDKNDNPITIKGNATTSGTLDYWYANNITGTDYESYVEDTIWCNDRSVYSLGGWNPDGGTTSSNYQLYFGGYGRARQTYTPDLTCTRAIDKFTVSEANGNGDLDYPVGLLTSDEIMLAGGANSSNSSYYLYTGQNYWAGSPSSFNYDNAREFHVNSSGILNNNNVDDNNARGVRPSISLKPGFTIASGGDGTTGNPYVVE